MTNKPNENKTVSSDPRMQQQQTKAMVQTNATTLVSPPCSPGSQPPPQSQQEKCLEETPKSPPSTPGTVQSTPDRSVTTTQPKKKVVVVRKKIVKAAATTTATTPNHNNDNNSKGEDTSAATRTNNNTTRTATTDHNNNNTKSEPQSTNPTTTPSSPSKTTTTTRTSTTTISAPKMAPRVAGNLKSPPRTTKAKLKTNNKTNHNNSVGLSELSTQLRLQRTKNDWQQQELDRLERQVQILSDLKGVSVAELRGSLESACQQQAHAELRNQVTSLQAQLQTLQLQRDAGRSTTTATTEATASKLATLQLRIGELEELDQTKQAETQGLYHQIEEQTAKAQRLETSHAQQETRIEQLEETVRQQAQKLHEVGQERQDLGQQVATLMQQVQEYQRQAELAQAVKTIDDQLNDRQRQKQAYLTQARQKQQQQQQQRPTGPPTVQTRTSLTASIPRVVGGGGASSSSSSSVSVRTPHVTAAEIATTVSSYDHDDDDDDEEDAVSRLGDNDASDTMSIHTMDAFLLQGWTEAHARETLAKDAKIKELYGELREQATKTSQLQTLCDNQKVQLDRLAQELLDKQNTLDSTHTNLTATKSKHDLLHKRFCDMESLLGVEQHKVQGLEKQLKARLDEAKLRKDQFDCRFKVQNDRIADLEQQQSSLYAAFEMLQQEVRAQDTEHNKLKSSLHEADSEVARQLRESEHPRKQGLQAHSLEHSSSSSRRQLDQSSLSHRNVYDDTFEDDFSASPTATTTVVSAYSGGNESPRNVYLPQELNPRKQQGMDYSVQMRGFLWKHDKVKGWKRRFFALDGQGGVCQLTYSDGPKERVKGTIANITVGVSTVAETNKSFKKPFSFVLHVNPSQPNAPVLYAAAFHAEDFQKWMKALKAATLGPESSPSSSPQNFSVVEAQLEAYRKMARQNQNASNRDLNQNDMNAQMEADHRLALRLSMQNQPRPTHP